VWAQRTVVECKTVGASRNQWALNVNKDVLNSNARHLLWFKYRYLESTLTATTVRNDSVDL